MKVSCGVGAIALFVSLTCTGFVSGAKPKIGNVRGGVVPSDDADSGGSDAVNGIAEEVQDDAAASAQHRLLGLKNKSDRKWMTQDKGKGVGRPKDKPDKGNGNGKGGGGNDSEEKDYIVTFKKMKTLGKGLTKCVDVSKGHKGTVKKNFSKVLDGCVMRLNPKELESIRNNPNIQFVEEDQEVYLSSYSWGLDRINQPSLPLDEEITKKDANGVTVYIIDTGIEKSHEDFDGVLDPASTCHKYVHDEDDKDAALTVDNGHGTHVASTACGVTYGVASNCRLCSVRVFNEFTRASVENVIAGIDHAVEDCDGSTKCVINMSLGGPKSGALNTAVANAVDEGVHVVVAAGNAGRNACNYSPASELNAITVGSTTEQDERSYFSNYGDCVDIFAPGSGIIAADNKSSNSYTKMSGTSMASPHVAGIAAFIAGTGSFTPAQLTAQMKAMAIRDVVKYSGSSHGDLASVLPARSCTFLVANILTDEYPVETSLIIVNKCTGEEIHRVNKYEDKSTSHEWESRCINHGKYEFTIKDSYGDGICCRYGRGSISASYHGYKVASHDEEFEHKGDFDSDLTWTLGSCAPVTPSPTESPTHEPTGTPTSPTLKPTGNPTRSPTKIPTSNPTESPTSQPTPNPTHSSPTNNPTESPTSNPTESPTSQPTSNPTDSPTKSPTNNPTESPTSNPTESPTSHPTTNPTDSPTKSPTNNPTESPTNNPTESPTSNPTESPTHSAAYNLGYSAGFADGFAEAAAGQE